MKTNPTLYWTKTPSLSFRNWPSSLKLIYAFSGSIYVDPVVHICWFWPTFDIIPQWCLLREQTVNTKVIVLCSSWPRIENTIFGTHKSTPQGALIIMPIDVNYKVSQKQS